MLYGTEADRDRLGVDWTQVPIVGGIITSIGQAIAGDVKSKIIDRVAAFQKLQVDIQNLQMAVASIASTGGNIASQAKVAAVRALVEETWMRWQTTARDIDATLVALNTGKIDTKAAAGHAARIAANVAIVHELVRKSRAAVQALSPRSAGSGVAPYAVGGAGLLVLGGLALYFFSRGRR